MRFFKLFWSFFIYILTLCLFAAVIGVFWFALDKAFINRIGKANVLSTGSMYPTFPKGHGASETVASPDILVYPNGFSLNGKSYFTHDLARGDIVTFSNDKTLSLLDPGEDEGTGFVKRIVALPGDTVEIREGLLYINDTPQKEPYTALPHSTFGGDFLPECKKVTVPEREYFVLGDNRKESNDSRHDLGFIKYSDIDGVITDEMQEGVLDKTWRDTSKDLDSSTKIKLNSSNFLSLINELRVKASMSELKPNSRLNTSASLRAQSILNTNDFSFEGSNGGKPMETALSQSGYSNTLFGEIPIQGYYDENELINYISEFPTSKEFILKKDFQDFGVAVVEGSLNGCPTQMIVLHLGGYVPPNYSPTVVESWVNTLENLKDIEDGWESLEENEDFYNDHEKQIDRLNEIIDTRISNLEVIVQKMKNNVWLSPGETAYLDTDTSLASEQNDLARFLNAEIK